MTLEDAEILRVALLPLSGWALTAATLAQVTVLVYALVVLHNRKFSELELLQIEIVEEEEKEVLEFLTENADDEDRVRESIVERLLRGPSVTSMTRGHAISTTSASVRKSRITGSSRIKKTENYSDARSQYLDALGWNDDEENDKYDTAITDLLAMSKEKRASTPDKHNANDIKLTEITYTDSDEDYSGNDNK
ncbi:unnamed protein product [Amoebophrya sp. A25]|nr:unnamed protein product [Amoebophrya sp. A25]|eukprot:GSA25T00005900001.1